MFYVVIFNTHDDIIVTEYESLYMRFEFNCNSNPWAVFIHFAPLLSLNRFFLPRDDAFNLSLVDKIKIRNSSFIQGLFPAIHVDTLVEKRVNKKRELLEKNILSRHYQSVPFNISDKIHCRNQPHSQTSLPLIYC